MPQLIDLEGLPEPVAKAITETVLNLKNQYREQAQEKQPAKVQKDLPSFPGKVIGSLRRVDIYEDR